MHIEEESERHRWNNPRWVMVISHGNFFLFSVNYGVHELAAYSVISIFLEVFVCAKINLLQYAHCKIKNTHQGLV